MTTSACEDRPGSYLNLSDFHRLNWACAPIRQAYGCPPYLVGSALYRPDYRDVDVRMILDDEIYDAMFSDRRGSLISHRKKRPAELLLNCAISDWLNRLTGLPVDFQFQSWTEKEQYSDRLRNPLGVLR